MVTRVGLVLALLAAGMAWYFRIGWLAFGLVACYFAVMSIARRGIQSAGIGATADLRGRMHVAAIILDYATFVVTMFGLASLMGTSMADSYAMSRFTAFCGAVIALGISWQWVVVTGLRRMTAVRR
jgi:hypothetical protein